MASRTKIVTLDPVLRAALEEQGVLIMFLENTRLADHSHQPLHVEHMFVAFTFSESPQNADFWLNVSDNLPEVVRRPF